jgi:membrane-bound ClpP family serine protease
VRRPEPVSLTAGLALIALGTLLLLEEAEVVDLGFGLLGPALLAAVGAILLVSGLSEGG